MNAHTKQAALEAFRKWWPWEPAYTAKSVTPQEAAERAWLRACEWMHEYATQAAYERAAQITDDCRVVISETSPLAVAKETAELLAAQIRALANESSGK